MNFISTDQVVILQVKGLPGVASTRLLSLVLEIILEMKGLLKKRLLIATRQSATFQEQISQVIARENNFK